MNREVVSCKRMQSIRRIFWVIYQMKRFKKDIEQVVLIDISSEDLRKHILLLFEDYFYYETISRKKNASSIILLVFELVQEWEIHCGHKIVSFKKRISNV